MKIAMVTEYLAPEGLPRFGGVDARTVNLARHLTRKNDVHIITTFVEGGNRVEHFDGVTIHRVGKKRKFTQRGDFFQRLQFTHQVRSEVIRLQPDIVDGSGFVSYAGSYRGAENIGVPSVATIHEVWQGEWFQNMGLINGFAGHILENQYLRYNFSGYISVSKFTKKRLMEKIGIEKERIAVVYNGIDLDLFNKTIADGKYPEPTIVTACRLVPYKRVDDLLRAVQLLRIDHPDVHLKIIGDGPHKTYLKNLSKHLKIENNIDFLGRLNDITDVIKVMKKSHVFALPSIVEGFGMVIVEAMAAGIPYVASDIPPIHEVTDGGVGGALCQPKNYEDLAAKLHFFLNDDLEQTNAIQKERINHVRRYEWQKLASGIEQWYEALCGGNA